MAAAVGVSEATVRLIMAILDYIDHHNRVPKPFIWTAKAADTSFPHAAHVGKASPYAPAR